MSAPADALWTIAAQLREEGSVIADRVVDPGESEPALGLLAAAGSRTTANGGEYAVVVEAIHEGYLLHYDTPRLIAEADAELALLAGDYLYALGLERLAALRDLEAVRELSDLISLCAQLHVEGRQAGVAEALWLGCVVAIACGASPAHEGAKLALREGDRDGAEKVLEAARDAAAVAGATGALDAASEAIDFAPRRG